MKQIYQFEQYTPPVLNENIIRTEIERRKLRWQTAMIVTAAALMQVLLVILGIFTQNEYPVIAFICFGYVLLSTTGGSVLAVVCTRKGGLRI